MKRIIIGGTNSGCGKTTVTCAVMQALVNRKMNVASFKCGPDYIDPMFHEKIIGTSSYNLDSFFCDDNTLKYLLCENGKNADISVIEGVMGFYDGVQGRGSAHSVSQITDTPAVIVIDCKGMSDSIGAVMKGFLEYKKPNNIIGFIFNRLPEKLADNAERLCRELGTEYFGFLPVNDLTFESRHLGLVTADEISDIKEKLNRLGELAEKNILFDKLICLSERPFPQYAFPKFPQIICKEKPVIAVAKDSAFCFIYSDNISLLEKLGCEIVYFSPLNDKTVPENADGLILCGGYPELYAEKLSGNTEMLADIRRKIGAGMPVIAECGGFMYLHDIMEDTDGNEHKTVGVINGKAYKTPKLCRFGYTKMTAESDNILCKKGDSFPAHEFHYWDSANCGQDFTAEKADGRRWKCAHSDKNIYAGFPHLYFYADTKTAENFVRKCLEYGGKMDRTAKITPPDINAAKAAAEHWNSVAKPLGSLGLLEAAVEKIAAVQGTADVKTENRRAVVMCADNGVVCEGVTQTDSSVTALCAKEIAEGRSVINVLADIYGAKVTAVDIGIERDMQCEKLLDRKIAYGTNNIANGAAMTVEQAEKAITVGMDIVRDMKNEGVQIIVTGEMGIGNTTASAALASVLLDMLPKAVTGRGAGLDSAGLERKIAVVERAVSVNRPDKNKPLELLAKLGGFDIAGMAGLFLGGAYYHIPVVIDGVISAAAALIACKINPLAREYMLASHASGEPSGKMLLESIGLKPLITAEMRLGEGTGGIMLLPLLDGALAVYNSAHRFDDLDMERYVELK